MSESKKEDVGLSVLKVASLAAWAVVGEKLCLPSLLRVSELFALNTECVVNSDLVLVGLMLLCSPVGGVRQLLSLRDWRTKAVAAVAAFLVGRQNVAARRARLQKISRQSFRIELSGDDHVWRSTLCPGGELMETVYPDVPTLYHNFFIRARTLYAQEKCIGRRTALGYEWLTYEETARRAESFGAGLLQLGINPGDKVGIYSVNNCQWEVAELGGYAYGIINVALYSTLGEEAVRYVVQHAEMVAVICHVDVLVSLLPAIPMCPDVKFIIFMDEAGRAPSSEQTAVAGSSGVRLLSFSEVEKMGRDHPWDHIPPKSRDLATIMYTSGTTGNPKGVMLAHSNIIANGTVYPVIVERVGVSLGPGDRYISYLPLAHIFERSALATMFGQGVAVGFYGGKTETLVDDISALRPTVLFGVPRVFNRVHDRVLQTVDKGSKVKQFLFRTALAESRRVNLAGVGLFGPHLPLWDALIFQKIKARLGGCCRVILSGGAPLSASTQEFLRAAFGCPVIQGYGLTETSAAGTMSLLEDPNAGHVGPPTPCTDIKLAPVPEMDYLPTDLPLPRGEICMRGGAIMQGYFKQPELTKEVIDEEGWFHTGDIGQMNATGTISITDRKKNIFKLSQGEYVAAEKLEVQYAAASLVSQIFVYGDSLQSVLVAVVVPDPDALHSWALSEGLVTASSDDKPSPAALCSLIGADKAVLTELAATGKKSGMKGFEIVRAVHLEPEAFSVENNLMTPTFKLRRPQLKAKYQAIIDQLYAKLG